MSANGVITLLDLGVISIQNTFHLTITIQITQWNLLESKWDMSFEQSQLCRWFGNKLTSGLMFDKEWVPGNVVSLK